jgi:signal transduction histidine kinase/phage shock protein PspC (stress-responsive transcriptional regulator)
MATDANVGSLRRNRQAGWLGGVCAGIAHRYGIDVALVRLAFVVAAAAGGVGVAAYALGWLLLPAGEAEGGRRRSPTGRGAVEVALGTALLLLSILLASRALGLWFSDAIVWPLVLVAGGGALLWRQSVAAPSPAAPATVPAAAPPRPSGTQEPRAWRVRDAAGELGRRAGVISRVGIGVVLVVAAAVAFLQATGALDAVRDVLLATVAVVVVLAVIFAPWIVRLARSLTQERAQRIRSQERAEVAAHLHDSVLQTLAMMQRRAGDPREVATLARRQERELRAWLADRPRPGEGSRLAAALEAAAAEVEEGHGVPVELVTVGDRDLDEPARGLVAAAREAMVNAAKFGGGSTVDVYVEASGDATTVFVRDRGPGFDPASVAPDRRGLRESIVGRMERHGGRAEIRSAPGQGTEIELRIEK